ncbi:MAG: hypothetical protein P1V97_32935, partial [Planctomycetota bacterium]|nr:hypothetical protein [Planctomycetota bacterium]
MMKMKPFAWLVILASLVSFSTADAQEKDSTIRRSTRLKLIEFRDVKLRDALRLLAEQTDMNFAPSKNAADIKISLFLRNVEVLEAVNVLCKANNLWFQMDEKSKIARIHTAKEYQNDIQSFREDRIETFTLLYPNANDVARAIQDLFGNRVQYNEQSNQQNQQATLDLQQRFQRFDIFDERSQGFGNQNNNGGNNRGNNNRNNNNGVFGAQNGRNLFNNRNRNGGGQNQNVPPTINLDQSQIRGLTGEQIQALQAGGDDPAVLRRLLGRTNIFVSVIQKLNKIMIRTGDERALKQIRELVKKLDVPTPMVLLEVKVLSIDLSDNFNSVFDYQASDGSAVAGGFTTGDILAPVSDAITGDSLRKASSLGLGGTGLRSDNLIFQYVHSHFRARMQLLENKNKVTVLATPMLLTANNEVSRLFIGEERPLNRGFQGGQIVNNIGGVQTTAGTSNIEFRPVGTTLLITPNINADRTVTLRILQENSQIVPNGANVLVPNNTGFIQQQVDIVSSRSVSGTVVAKDGLALAIGGLIEEGVSDNRAQVPWIGRIPLLGFFFRRENRGRFRRELIIMVRPYVLNTPAQSESVSKKLIEELSVHPNALDAKGGLGTFTPDEVLKPAKP